MSTIYWAGDSTVQTNDYTTYPQTGIGQVFSLFLKPDVKVSNHAKNGRSTKSFINEGRMIPIYDSITEGDFLFIQFGHNDEKSEDPSRYTDPEGDFEDYLERFINVARNKKAYPVLISPLERRHFDENGNLKPGMHRPYAEGMIRVSKRLNVPYINLLDLSRDALQSAGDEGSKKWHMYFGPGEYDNYPDGSEDNTHLRYDGAVKYASLIAKGLRELGGIYNDILLAQE